MVARESTLLQAEHVRSLVEMAEDLESLKGELERDGRSLATCYVLSP